METIPKIRKPQANFRKTVRENGNLSDSSENQSLNPLINKNSSSPQTYQTVQTIHTSQIAEGKEIQGITNVIKEEVASTEVLLAEEVDNNSSFGQEKPSFTKENNSGVRSIFVTESNQEVDGSTIVGGDKHFGKPKPYSPQHINWRWLPDGPWNVDGKLDREFQEWLAKKWMAEYNRTDIYM